MSGEIVSYHLVGRFEDSDSVWIAPLNANLVPEKLSTEDIEALKSVCHRAGAIPVCTLRGRRDLDGNLEYWHGWFSEPPSSEDNIARMNALLRIVAQDRNSQNPAQELERLSEDVKVLEELK